VTVPGALTRVARVVATAVWIFVLYHAGAAVVAFSSDETRARRRARLHRRAAVRIRVAAIHLRGVFIKFGQFMSARVDILPEEYTEELAALQDQVPPMPFPPIRERLVRELGREVEAVFPAFDDRPIAAASLGQVHEARLPDGRRVAVKVQYPGIQSVVGADLRAARLIVRLLQWRFPRIRFDKLYDEFARVLQGELNYLNEGRSADRFRANFADEASVVVPEVIWPYTTAHVLTLEYVEGVKITQFAQLEALGIDLRAVARLVARAYMQQILVHRFFHGDPHPGNLFVQRAPDGSPRLAFVDFGIMQRITPQMHEGITRTIRAVIERDVPEVVRGLQALGFVAVTGNVGEIERAVDFFMDRYRDMAPRMFKNITAFDVADDIEQFFRVSHALQVPNNFILFGRTAGMLSGLCARLDPELNLIELAKPYAVEFLVDRRGRWATWLRRGREAAELLTALPRELHVFLTRANRGEFQTLTSSEEVTGGLARLYGVSQRALLAAVGLAFMWSSVALAERGHATAAGLCAAAAVVVFIMFVASMSRR
jgi:predicted unusual protein kinase regulating ubiquinone biosynthesis (AarF/ABC1/UbiB family)